MPVFVDPSIPLSGRQPQPQPSMLDRYSKMMDLKSMAQQGQINQQVMDDNERQRQLQEEAAAKQKAEAAALRKAMLRNAEKDQAGNITGINHRGVVNELTAAGMPEAAQTYQQKQLELSNKIKEWDDKEFERNQKGFGVMSQMAGAVVNSPPEQRAQVYRSVLARAAEMKVPGIDKLPKDYDPAMDGDFQGMYLSGISAESQMRQVAADKVAKATAAEATRKAAEPKTQNMREFRGSFYPLWLEENKQPKNARSEMLAWKEFHKQKDAPKPTVPVPGRDIPFPKEVEDQRTRMAARSGVATGVTPLEGNVNENVEAILTGRNTLYNIRLTMGRTDKAAAFMDKLRHEITAIDPKFDFVASDAGGKATSQVFFQRSIAAVNAVLPNIKTIVALSEKVGRLGIASVDDMLQRGAVQFGNKKVANFRQAQKLIADEIGVALGAGTVSDMKLQLGFDVTDPSVSPEVFASNMAIVKEFVENRKDGLNQLRYKSSTRGGDDAGGSETVRVRSKDGKVGTIPKEDLPDALKEGYTVVK